jgi:hypothetical protein
MTAEIILCKEPRAPPLPNSHVVPPLHTAEVYRIGAFEPESRMPHIASRSRAPVNEHRDSANRNSVRGGGRHDYHYIPAR